MGFGGTRDPIHSDVNELIVRYQQLGIAFNEINRSLELLDVVPEIFVQPVIAKLRFVHELILGGRGQKGVPPQAEPQTTNHISTDRPASETLPSVTELR